jgi:DNA polymerase
VSRVHGGIIGASQDVFEHGPFVGLPRGYFKVAHIDPPWQFHAWSHRGDGKGACQHYQCQTLDDTMALPVSELVAPDAAIFLWVVQPMLPEAMRVLDAWGFTYRTVAFVWNKMPKNWSEDQARIQPRMGLGYHTRSGSEQCWLATRGKGYRRQDDAKNIEQVVVAPIREHSRKPDEVAHRIDRLTGDVPRIELFAREQRPGWVCWGDQVGLFTPVTATAGLAAEPVEVIKAERIVIDAEARSLVDLPQCGPDRYAADPSTQVLCVGYKINDQPAQIWLPGEPVPAAILAAGANPDCLSKAHNAAFEIAITKNILVPQHGWPELPLERWRCTQAASLALALPAKLKKVAIALSLPQQKGDDRIVGLMSKPRGFDIDGNPIWEDRPEKHKELQAYCLQDVETEWFLDKTIGSLSAAEQLLWCIDQTINGRGFYCDGHLIEKSIAIVPAAEQEIRDKIRHITKGVITTARQVERIKQFAAARGVVLENLEKDTVAAALRQPDIDPVVRQLLEARREGAPAGASKMHALHRWRARDGRVRGAFRFHGAAPGRWSSRGVQVQNFKKEVEGTAEKVAAVMAGDLAAMRTLGAPLELIGDVVRAAICAAPGNRLLVGDFSGIESVVLAWLAGDKNKIEQWAKYFRTGVPGDDPYYILGIALGFSPETARQYGKIADLAFGYGGSIPAYRNFAPADDNTSDEQILQYRNVWRQRHPRIKDFWYRLNDAAVEAVQHAGRTVPYGRFTLQCEQIAGGNFLFITLPSGRRISYPFARIIEKERVNGYGEKIKFLAVTHMDNAENVGGWAEVRGGEGMWPGQWAENVTQGVARDVLAAAMQRLEAAGYPVVLHVHDEIVVELPVGEGNLDEFRHLIERLPEWAAGMPIGSKVRNGPRFVETESLPVQHIAGSVDAPQWAPASKTKAQPGHPCRAAGRTGGARRPVAGYAAGKRGTARQRRSSRAAGGVGDRAREHPPAQRERGAAAVDNESDPGRLPPRAAPRPILQCPPRGRRHHAVGYSEYRRTLPRSRRPVVRAADGAMLLQRASGAGATRPSSVAVQC